MPPRTPFSTALAVCLLTPLALAQPTDRTSLVAGISGRYDATIVSETQPLPPSFEIDGAGFGGVARVTPRARVGSRTTLRVTGGLDAKNLSLNPTGSFDSQTGELDVTIVRKVVKSPSIIDRLMGAEPTVSLHLTPVHLTPDAAGTLRGTYDGAPIAFLPAPVSGQQPTTARASAKPDGGRVVLKIEAEAKTLLVSYGPAEDGWLFFEWAERPVRGNQRVVTADRVNLRTGPGTGNKRVTQARKGECFRLLEERGGWCKLALPDGQELWGSSTLLGTPGTNALQVIARLTLTGEGDGWAGTLASEDGSETSSVTLARRRRVLVFTDTGSDAGAFGAYARQVINYYTSEKGFAKGRHVVGENVQVALQTLRAAGAKGLPYDRVVFVAHGGWDGPFFGSDQTSGDTETEHWPAFVAAIRRGTTPTARLYSSSCHGGGSDRYERRDGDSSYIWSRDLANRTGRMVAGPAGITSTEFTLRQVKAALEGEGTVQQETAWDGPQGSHRIYPGKALQVDLN